ncbi:FHA domain-containing protein [Cryobacterium sp. SO1]|uniref:FHA domain-containing protein n=1 Tax=Cryobacterium sp. SO1 TaxID=1897061 RepID=UPI00210C19FB|nr:FHA domain-containing protein [Cryobacterium sp. SO1]
MGTHLDIDLAFTIEPAGEPPPGVHGTIRADGLDIDVFLSDPERFVRARMSSLPALRTVAADLAERGLVVSVSGPDGVIARMGAVQAPLAQRLVTKSPHLMLGSASAVTQLVRRWRQPDAAGRAVPAPPPTPFPLVPTLARRIRRRVTTTHYAPGAGRPRLIFVVGSENWNGRPPREFDLLPGVTRIGSDADADLRLDGLSGLHAEIRHDENDEYLLIAHGPVGGGAKTDAPSTGLILRTGARLEMGPWRMGFFREEYADHGRPFGGRLGGELSVQKPQPSRTGVSRRPSS